MHFKRHLELKQELRQIDITPLIAMVFQLLMFVTLFPSFIMQPGIRVNLPKAVTSESVKLENIELVVSSENVVYLDGKILTTEELKALLRQVAKRKQPILIKADIHASLGEVVEIWDICRALGANQINIATNQD
jgi:biopolymer transport protein ExbD